MKIIDKTNDTWKIGDTVIDNNGRIGMIKKDKDDDFVILRIDDKHVGDYCYGFVYQWQNSMQCLQRNASEFHKVNDNNDNEDWQPGDFVKDDHGNIGLIINVHGIFEIIRTREKNSIEKDFSASFYHGCFAPTLDDLKEYNPAFRKVPAKVILGEE